MADTTRFSTAISCMDGRFIPRVLDQLETRFGARNIDLITTAGAVKHLAGVSGLVSESILDDVATSIKAHRSTQLAVVAHGDCAGNPIPDGSQKDQLKAAGALLRDRFPEMEVLTLFLDPRTGFQNVSVSISTP